MPEYVPAPSYPDYAKFLSGLIGNLPTDYRNAQLQQGQVDVQNAFKGGVPTNPDGTPNYAQALQTLAKAGDPGAVGALGPAAQQQVFQQQAPGTLSPMLSGGAGGSAAPPPAAPVQLSSAPASAPAAAPPQPSGGPTLTALVSSVAPDPAQSAKATAFLAKVLGVDPTAPLTPDQAARAQRIMAAAKLGPSGPGQLSAPVRWDLMPGQGAPGAGATAQQPRGLRNNNPGNLESNAFTAKLPGYAGSDGRFAVFDSADAGNAALDRNLQSYARQGISTPLAIAAKWAPGSEAGNNPASYGGAIASALGVRPNQSVDLSDPDTRAKVAGAITRVENGPAATSGGAPQGNRPIFPQVPLPPGITDPQQAILEIDREIAKASTNPNPYAQRQLPALQDWRDRIAASAEPREVRQGQSFVDAYGRTVYTAPLPGSTFDDETIRQMAQQARAGDTSVFQNIGRGVQGPGNIVKLRQEITRQNEEAGDTGSDQAMRNAEFFGVKSGERTLGTKQANIEMAATEFKNVIPVVRAASLKVQRTNYPDLNAIVQAGEKHTGDPNIVAFGSGVNTLVNLYARAISPSGTPTVSDKEHAREILSAAWSQGQFDAAVSMMQQEIDAALNSPEKVRADMRKRFGGAPADETTPPAPAQGATGGGGGANGQPARVTKEQYDALPKGAPFIAVDDPTQTPRTKP